MSLKQEKYGNESLFELKNQIEQENKQEIEADVFKAFEKEQEKIELLFARIKERLNEEEFELFRKLRNEEVTSYNDLEQKFFAGKGCFDYVWVEWNGQKNFMF